LLSFETLPSLSRLRTFTTVAATGSALSASARLRISQPAVSYSLNRLEAELGVRLFERKVSGSYVTPAGKLLQNRTTRLFSQVVEALRQVAGPDGLGQDKAEALAWKLRETQVRALIAIWRTGSFRAAAHELGMTEPSLQRPARELERLLRVSLYRRTATGVEVNPTGAELARRLSVALTEIWCAVEEIGAALQTSRAGLRVGVLALSPRPVLADAATELLLRQPQQRIDVIEDSYEQHVRALRSGDIDLIYGALRAPPIPDDLIEQRLFDDPYVFVCRASHPLAAGRMVTPRQLAQYDFVLPPQGLPRRAVLDRMLALWDIKPKARIETSCLATILALLRGSDRVSLLSRWHVERATPKDLTAIKVAGAPYESRFIGLTTRTDWLPTPFQEGFLKLIHQAAKTHTADAKPARSRERMKVKVV
jgi:LysR family transcriptional regulator, regulator for genes of the gallate degradation pathway